MFKRIKNFILKLRCRKIYKQLPQMVKMQLYLEMMQPGNSDLSYSEILKREFELKSEVNNGTLS